LVGTLLSPGETFEDINRKPTFLVPLLIGILTYALFLTFITVWVKPDWKQIVRAQSTRISERFGTPPPTEEDIERGAKFAKYQAIGSGLIIIPIWYLVAAGALALGMLLMQAKTTFKRILSVFAWVSCSVGLVYSIVATAAIGVRDTESLKDLDISHSGSLVATNLSHLLPSDSSPILKAIASSMDVFNIWEVALLIIGLAAIAGTKRIKKSSTAVLVLGLWGVVILLKVGFAALGF
jgi:hypothetical protein